MARNFGFRQRSGVANLHSGLFWLFHRVRLTIPLQNLLVSFRFPLLLDGPSEGAVGQLHCILN